MCIDVWHFVSHQLIAQHVTSAPFLPINWMSRLEDWYDQFTSLFIAVNFPDDWIGKRTQVRGSMIRLADNGAR